MVDIAEQTYIEVLSPQEEIEFEYRDCINNHNVMDEQRTIMISMGGQSTGVAFFTNELLRTEMFQIGKNYYRGDQTHVARNEIGRLVSFLNDMIFNPDVRQQGGTQTIFLSANLTHVLIPNGDNKVQIDAKAYENERKNPQQRFISEIIEPILASLQKFDVVNGSQFQYILFDARWNRSMTNDPEHIIIDVGSSACKVNGIVVSPSFTSMIDETRMCEQFHDRLREGQTLENWQLNRIFDYLQDIYTKFDNVRLIGTEGLRNFMDANDLPRDENKILLHTLLSCNVHPLCNEYLTMRENNHQDGRV